MKTCSLDYLSSSMQSVSSRRCYDKWMRYIPQKDLSLTKLSMVSIISTFWQNGRLSEDLHSVVRCTTNPSKERIILIGKAKELLMKLEIPSVLMEELLSLLEWITNDYVSYVDRLMSNEFFPYNGNLHGVLEKIKWNMHGSVDEVQTFKTMKYSNYHYNYMVSMLYCLEEHIPQMWARLSTVYKSIFSLKKIYSEGFDSYASYIIYYWTSQVKRREFFIDSLGDPIGLLDTVAGCSINLKMWKVSLHTYNIHSLKYFWHKLDSGERAIAITIFSDTFASDDSPSLNHFYDSIKNNVEIILFTLSQISDEERLTVIRRCLVQIILTFWQYWQVHHAILPLFESYVEFLDDYTYKNLINTLINNSNTEYSPKGKLLYLMWEASPPRLQCLISNEDRKLIFMGNQMRKLQYDDDSCVSDCSIHD